MARRKNYTTEQLKEYVDGYVRQKNDYSVITATALADYCNDTLHLLPAVTYQTFTRDKGVMQYIEKINTDIQDFKNAIAQKNNEIVQAQTTVDRYKKQLDDVRNNREYDTLNKEIEFQTLEIQLCEKKIREAETKIAEKEEDLKNAQALVVDRQEALTEKKSELTEIMQETKEVEEKLREKAKDLETRIEPRLLTSFKRIRKNARNGLGIVYVQRDACGGCFNKIPPQRQLDIKMHKKIIVCEYCGRIMIDPELAGVKPVADPAVETKKPRRTSSRAKKAPKAEE